MKLGDTDTATEASQSHPARGGWIEIVSSALFGSPLPSPTPHGVGGLKYLRHSGWYFWYPSHPARGGWIEM